MVEKRLGLALGSGAAKGFAHIGVLKALEENGVRPDVITGSSMGSLIGAFYVTGMKPRFMERLACTLSWRHWLDLTIPKVGLVAGSKIHDMVSLLTRGLNFPDLQIPFGVVATELTTRKSVLITEGKIADAVRASISIPGVFVPFVYREGVYIDGGVLERVPIDACKQLGADVVISVDVTVNQNVSLPETIMDVIMYSIDLMQHQLADSYVSQSDLCIEPDVSMVGTSQFHKARDAIEAGYLATLAMMDEIIALDKDCHAVMPKPKLS